MALLDNMDANQSPGLLGSIPPQALVGMLMMGVGSGMRRRGGNAGGGGGGNDSMGPMMSMMQAQEAAKRQAMQDQLEWMNYQRGLSSDRRDETRLGLEQNRFKTEQEKSQREADIAAKAEELRNQSAQAVLDYKAPVGEMPYVAPEYETPGTPAAQEQPQNMAMRAIQNQVQAVTPMPQDNVQVPTENYINNIAQAGRDAQANAPKGAFNPDAVVRQQVAALLRSADPADHRLAFDLLTNGGPTTMSPGQTRISGTGEPIYTAPNPQEGKDKAFQAEENLRNKYIADSQQYQELNSTYGRIQASREVKIPNRASDLSLLYNYMRMINPQIRLNENTEATASNSPGVSAQIREQWNKLVKNQSITPQARDEIYAMSDNLYKSSYKTQEQLSNEYSRVAKSYGVNPDNIIIHYGDKPKEESVSPTATAAPKNSAPMVKMLNLNDNQPYYMPAENVAAALASKKWKRG